MYRLLLDVGGTIDLGRSEGVLQSQCLKVLPMYALYLDVLVAAPALGIDTSKRRLEPDGRSLSAALLAGASGATAQDLGKMLVGESPGAKCMIAELLARREPRIERLSDWHWGRSTRLSAHARPARMTGQIVLTVLTTERGCWRSADFAGLSGRC